MQNTGALENLLQALYDPNNAQYQQFLSSSAFDSQFSSTTQYSQLNAWAASQGLQTTTFTNNRLLIVKGTIAVLESAFGVNFNYYAFASGGQFYAPDRSATMLASAPTLYVGTGFNNFNQPANNFFRDSASRPTLNNTGSGPNGSFYGPDFRALYAPGTSLDGTGQRVGAC